MSSSSSSFQVSAPVLAQRIADYRDTNGPFNTVEDLLDVPGIGEGKLAALRDAVTIP